MTSQEILSKYLKFFEKYGHKQIPNVSLVPENDPSLLFVNSGMFPLVPYLFGETHPLGKRLVNIQRCLRLEDIDEIGDSIHTLAFHMLGNWSLGDYFKKEQLFWIYQFFIEEMKLDPKRMYATVFEGDESAPRDEESIEIIKEIFKKYGIDAKEGERIFPCGKENNWWQRGDAVGEPGGPDSEIFYYIGDGDPKGKNPIQNESEFLEFGNSVFMQYKKSEKGWEELPQKNVDFGGSFERIAMIVQNKKDIFEIDNFWPIIEKAQELTGKKYEENKSQMRILADHMRGSVLLAMDGVEPGNKDQGYILRRLLRKTIRVEKNLGVEKDLVVSLVGSVVDTLSWLYPDLKLKQKSIEEVFVAEEIKFTKTLEQGQKEVAKILSAKKEFSNEEAAETAFNLYQSLGYPYEIFLGDLVNINEKVSLGLVREMIEKHQETSRAGVEAKFKSGLADSSDLTVKYHTMAHLVQAAMKAVLDPNIEQLGSNINAERLRYDFPYQDKLTDEEIKKVTDWLNDIIAKKLPVVCEIMPKEEAITKGANYLKWENYPDPVKVYYIGNSMEDAVSKEFCGGPHVKNTSELKPIEIYKQENIGRGKRRIYARFVR